MELFDHDPAWSRRFAGRSAELRRVLGPRALFVEHVGSTAVPGLAAKNVVDILLGVLDPDDEPAYLPDLLEAGYDLRVREPAHRCLRAGDPDRSVNLHCYPPGHPEVHLMLQFRDRLRTHPADRQRYEDTKRALAGQEWPTINRYAEAKTAVVRSILRGARETGRDPDRRERRDSPSPGEPAVT